MKGVASSVGTYGGQGAGTDGQGRLLPIWLVLGGNLVMGASLWLIAAGGMGAKLILLALWIAMLCSFARSVRFAPGLLVGSLVFAGLFGVIVTGSGSSIEKLRLTGNLLMLPVGLYAGLVIGRDCLRVMMPVLVLYLLLTSSFYMTHEGTRLNQPFLFLGLFALCSVVRGAGALGAFRCKCRGHIAQPNAHCGVGDGGQPDRDGPVIKCDDMACWQCCDRYCRMGGGILFAAPVFDPW